MSREPRGDGTAPPLLPRGGLLALGAVAVCAFAALFPFAYRRVTQAAEEAPSGLSLTYLRLAMAEDPSDASLKLRFAEAALALGNLREAQAALSGLRERTDAVGHAAQKLDLRIEHAAWAAVPQGRDADKRQALARYRAALARLKLDGLPPDELETLAERAREADRPDLRATLLSDAVRKTGARDPELVKRAERAYLELERPLDAAHLAAESAEQTGRLDDALRSLTHARAAARPSESAALFTRLVKRVGRRTPLLEAGLTAAIDRGDHQAALALAEELLAREPQAPARHAAVLQLASWSGQSELALVEQLWLLEHGAGREVWNGAAQNARALSDLRALRTLYEQGGHTERLPRDELLQLVAVYEALGDAAAAHELLIRALSGRYASDYELWNLRLLLERARGRFDQALETLRSIDARFPPDIELRELRADLLLSQGRAEEALSVLADVTPPDDYPRLMQLARVANAAADVGAARRAYRDATRLEQATEADFAQLYALDMLDGDLSAARDTAQRGLIRYQTPAMLELAFDSALKQEDHQMLAVLFAASETEGHPFQMDPRYVALRTSYRQARAAIAIERGDVFYAQRLLGDARRDLLRGIPHAEGQAIARLEPLVGAQRAQELSLALAKNDGPALRVLYPEVASTLSPRERVHVLHRLERDEEAVKVALTALEDGSVGEAEREGLVEDAKSLSQQVPRHADATLELLDMGTLKVWQARVQATYTATHRAWSGGLSYAALDVEGDAHFTLKATHELIPWVGLSRRWRDHEAAAQFGINLRDGRSARPYVGLSSRLRFQKGPQLIFAAQVDEVPNDTAALRALGLRDQVSAAVEVPFAKRWFSSASAAGALYSSRNRELLGGGATFEGMLGMRLFPATTRILHGNVRLAVRAAPRWSKAQLPDSIASDQTSPAGWLVPDSSTFVGVGGTLGKGQIALPPVWGREVVFLADANVGYLVPQRELGFFARGGVGTSLLGRDQLSLSGQASNVVGTAPTSTIWSVTLDYATSLWR